MTDDPPMRDGPADRLSQPIIQLDLSAELAEVRAGGAYEASDHAAKTLVKEPGLDVALLAIKAGGTVHEHRAHVPILVQTLEGHVRFWVQEHQFELDPGRLLAVDANLPHSLTTQTDAAVLLTLGLKHKRLPGPSLRKIVCFLLTTNATEVLVMGCRMG